MRRQFVLLTISIILATACASSIQLAPEEETPPFELRPTAWRMVIENSPILAKRNNDPRPPRLEKALAQFYEVIADRREDRTATEKRERRKACAKGWTLLTREIQLNKELKGELILARTYLGIECQYAKKSIPTLRTAIKQRKTADFVFYASQFWYAETLLAMDRGAEALQTYRWILGELDSPLYPLAMVRTAHCHWDDNNVDQAREYLEHVRDWIGVKTSPPWILSLKAQVLEDLQSFDE